MESMERHQAHTGSVAPTEDGNPPNGELTDRLRILLLAPSCDPEAVSVPLVAYSHAAALAELHDVTLVVQSPFEDAVRRAKASFRSIEVIRTPTLDRIWAWSFRRIFRCNYDTQLLTAFSYPFTIAVEWFAWRQLRRRIFAGEFDIVLRILPITAVLPSPWAYCLRKGPIPFVVGPVNGGLPWPPGFEQLQRQREWVSRLRALYRYFPFARSTYRNASAVIVASSQTYYEFSAYREKLFFIPENGVSRSVCSPDACERIHDGQLRLIFVGGLVPRKACDIALRAAAPLLRDDRATFTIVGDGPERQRLEELTRSLGIEKTVDFRGWLQHAEVLEQLRSSDVMIFPSVRDFGGGVVFEALATGAVPVVVDFGGPGDIVHPEVGFKVPLTNEGDVAARIQGVLAELAANPDLLSGLRRQGQAYARECLTWEAKARATTKVLRWALGRGSRPNLLPPKALTGLTGFASQESAPSPSNNMEPHVGQF